jgi:N-acetylmuramoyl-L-alanine amidase
MSVTKEQIDKELSSSKSRVSYNNVETASSNVKETFDNVKKTEVGKNTGEVIGGIQSVTSKTDDLNNTINNTPTEGLVTSGALDAVNPALNTDIGGLSAPIGVPVSITYTDSGAVDTIDTSSKKTSGSLSSILSGITGLGVAPGYLQNMISNANSKGLNTSLNSVNGKVGAFSSISSVNALSSRTQSVINTITSNASTDGSSISSTYLNNFSTEGTSAINDVAITVTKATSASKTLNVLEAISGTKGSDVLPQVRNYKNTRAGVVNQRNKFLSDLNRAIPLNNLGFMQNVVRKIDPASLDTVFTVNKIILEENEKAEIIELSQGSPQQKLKAKNILRKKTGKTTREIEEFLNQLDSTVAGSVIVDTSNSVFEDPFSIGGTDGQWNNGVGAEDFTFSFISSVEELDAEFRSIFREVTEMVVHWTETYSNSNIGAEEINKTQLALGLDGIGYHYVIRRDGSVQRGRPVNNQGQHADINGHNERSIGVVFVGGINAPTGTPNPLEYKSVNSLTRSQFTSFQEICKAFYRVFPGGQILGHNDLDPLEDDPGFDVRDFCEDVFGKKSLFVDTTSESPFTAAQINQTEVPS